MLKWSRLSSLQLSTASDLDRDFSWPRQHTVCLRVTVKALFFFEAPPRHFEAQPHYFLMKTLKRKGAGHVARCCGSREHLWAAGRKSDSYRCRCSNASIEIGNRFCHYPRLVKPAFFIHEDDKE